MSTVDALNQQIKDLEELVARRDKALRLEKVPEFRDVILQDFCVTECARYAQLSGDPALKKENREDALALAQAAGHLRRYLSVIVQMGNRAVDEIVQVKEALEEAHREEA